MIWIAKLLGLGSWLKNAALSAFDLARRYPLQAALLCAVVALFWQYRTVQHARADRDAARHEIAALIEASRQAKAEQQRINQANLAANQEANHANEVLRQQVTMLGRSSRDAYADAHRLRTGSDCISPPGTAALPVAPPVDDHTATNGEYVAVSRQDFDKLTDASLQAAVQYEWGQSMISAGLAIPDPALGR